MPTPPAPGEYAHINRYWDRVHKVHTAKILPGEYYVSAHGEMITTVLGSCISACVRDTRLAIGGMNHFMLPHGNRYHDQWENTGVGAPNRYGNYAMEHMINDMLKMGAVRSNLEIKVFGGGKVMKEMTDVGDRNIRFIHEYIQEEGLLLAGEDVGDIYPRKILYFTDTGRVRVKKLRSLHNDTILARESRYMREIDSAQVVGEVELFD